MVGDASVGPGDRPYAAPLRADSLSKPIYQIMASAMTAGDGGTAHKRLVCDPSDPDGWAVDHSGLRVKSTANGTGVAVDACHWLNGPNFGTAEVDWDDNRACLQVTGRVAELGWHSSQCPTTLPRAWTVYVTWTKQCHGPTMSGPSSLPAGASARRVNLGPNLLLSLRLQAPPTSPATLHVMGGLCVRGLCALVFFSPTPFPYDFVQPIVADR